MATIRRVNMLSGGLASWATGKLVAKQHGTDGLIHLFADTSYEDPDLYRFLPQAVANIGGELVTVSDGRTPWELFEDEGVIGNTRVAICSRKLKREPLDAWLNANCDPANTILYVGLLWFERHRFEGRMVNGEWKPGIRERYAALGWKCESPLIETKLAKPDLLAWLEREGIDPPGMYDDGFTSNNCRGACVKQGMDGWRRLLLKRPASFAEAEAEENAFRARTGKDVAILRDRRGGANAATPADHLSSAYRGWAGMRP